MKQRENGFYWVKKDGVWIPAQWKDSFWLTPGSEVKESDSDFEGIKEERIPDVEWS